MYWDRGAVISKELLSRSVKPQLIMTDMGTSSRETLVVSDISNSVIIPVKKDIPHFMEKGRIILYCGIIEHKNMFSGQEKPVGFFLHTMLISLRSGDSCQVNV